MLALFFSFENFEPLYAQDQVSKSVVKIIATKRYPDLSKPWAKKSPQEESASGVIIDNNRILTNAHVVAFASQMYIQPYQSAEKLEAEVIAIAPGIDLALLKLDDESFFNKYPNLPFVDSLPKIKDTVNVYGYPLGGEEQSVTVLAAKGDGLGRAPGVTAHNGTCPAKFMGLLDDQGHLVVILGCKEDLGAGLVDFAQL